MCQFITATVPGEADLKAVRRVIGAHRLGFAVVENEWVQRQLPEGDVYLCLTRGMCDCGTVLGCLHGADGELTGAEAAEIEKRRKKGWGAPKIARWQAEKGRTVEKRARERATAAELRQGEADAWIAFLSAVLDPKVTPRIGLLVHGYRSGPDTDRVEIRRREPVPLERATPELLMAMEEGVLYDFWLERAEEPEASSRPALLDLAGLDDVVG